MHLDPLQAHLPFAVVGSTEEVKVGNKLVRARQYPWGVVQGECGGESASPARPEPRPLPCVLRATICHPSALWSLPLTL